jgi:CO/xanthine dehydrogenase FAD-binding subunit
MKEYFLPESLAQAAGLLAEHGPSLLVMAGGTLVMPLINEGLFFPEKVMGLRRAGLAYTRPHNGHVVIGATTPLTQLAGLETLPLLQSAAHHTAAWAVRNMATVGGNLFARPPYGDIAVALLALDAQVKLVSHSRERLLPLADFYSGTNSYALQPGELLAEIHVPIPAGQTAYLKYGRRRANTPAVVTVAAHIVQTGGKVKTARLALNGAGPHPLRATAAETVLAGSALDAETIAAAAEAAVKEAQPYSDAIASEWYRRKMVGLYVKRALAQIAGMEA